MSPDRVQVESDRGDILEAARIRREARVTAPPPDKPRRHPKKCDCLFCVNAAAAVAS